MDDITNELLAALLTAPIDRRKRALLILKGETPPPSTTSGPMLLTMGKAARQLGVSRSTIYRMVLAGVLPSIEIAGGRARVRRTDLEMLARDGAVSAEGGAA
jgi:excisionase family DNA binding protein